MSRFALAILAAACSEALGTQCTEDVCSSGTSESQQVHNTNSLVQKTLRPTRLLAVQTPATSVIYGDDAHNECPDGYTRITDLGECRAAMPLLVGGDPDDFMGTESAGDFPTGCYSCSESLCGDGSGVWFNRNTTNTQHSGARPICQKGFVVRTGETIFVGDSDIDYWHSSSDAVPGSYNLGIGGATCADVDKEIDFILDRFQPKSVVLVCGENDLAGNSGNVAKTFASWIAVVGKISAAGVPIVQLGTKPEADSTNLHARYKRYDGKIKQAVAARAQTNIPPPIVFVDTYKAFMELGNGDEYYDPDEAPNYLHLGPKGYALWDRWVQNGLSNRLGCVLWNGDKCEKQVRPLSVLKASTNECPAGYRPLQTEAECKAAVGLMPLAANSFQDSEESADWPAGCYYCKDAEECTDGTWFNRATHGEVRQGARLYCQFVR